MTPFYLARLKKHMVGSAPLDPQSGRVASPSGSPRHQRLGQDVSRHAVHDALARAPSGVAAAAQRGLRHLGGHETLR